VSRDTWSHYIRAGCAGRAPAKISRNIYTVAHGVKRELPPNKIITRYTLKTYTNSKITVQSLPPALDLARQGVLLCVDLAPVCVERLSGVRNYFTTACHAPFCLHHHGPLPVRVPPPAFPGPLSRWLGAPTARPARPVAILTFCACEVTQVAATRCAPPRPSSQPLPLRGHEHRPSQRNCTGGGDFKCWRPLVILPLVPPPIVS